ncbi:MAG: hypothetical protein HUU47_08240 [Bacteroidetes bacterium]|nr:hypothetical protein [Bacteroidota bacterium]
MKKYISSKNFTLILINLIPLFGVFYWGWYAYSIILFYVAETLLVGFIHVIKMTALYFMNSKRQSALSVSRNNSGVRGAGLIPFFIFHFGFFVFVQMMVFGGFTNQNLLKVFPVLFTDTYKYALSAIFLTKITVLIAELFWDPDSDKKLPDDVFFEPYPRIIVQQFMVILGSWFSIIGNSIIGYLIILIVCKTVLDIGFANFDFTKFKKKAD